MLSAPQLAQMTTISLLGLAPACLVRPIAANPITPASIETPAPNPVAQEPAKTKPAEPGHIDVFLDGRRLSKDHDVLDVTVEASQAHDSSDGTTFGTNLDKHNVLKIRDRYLFKLGTLEFQNTGSEHLLVTLKGVGQYFSGCDTTPEDGATIYASPWENLVGYGVEGGTTRSESLMLGSILAGCNWGIFQGELYIYIGNCDMSAENPEQDQDCERMWLTVGAKIVWNQDSAATRTRGVE